MILGEVVKHCTQETNFYGGRLMFFYYYYIFFSFYNDTIYFFRLCLRSKECISLDKFI